MRGSRTTPTLIACVLTTLLGVVGPAVGHEFWIEPSQFTVGVDALLTIGVRVGDGFPGQPVVRDADHIDRFVIAGPGGTEQVAGRDGRHPAGITRVATPGLHVIGYRSRPTSIELAADAFEHYLREDGLERIIELRAERGASDRPGRESYSRCAKSLVAVGDGGEHAGHDRVLGFPLELVPQSNPMDLENGAVSFKLLHEGKPCAGVMVSARHRERPDRVTSLRTDERGLVTFELDAAGLWLVSGVHMVEAPAGSRSDWQSHWASLTFERGTGS